MKNWERKPQGFTCIRNQETQKQQINTWLKQLKKRQENNSKKEEEIVQIRNFGIVIFVMQIKLNYNPVINKKVNDTTKPLPYKN